MTSRPIRDLVKRNLAGFPALTHAARFCYVALLNARLEAGAALRYVAERATSAGRARPVWEAALPLQPVRRVRLPVEARFLQPESLLAFCRDRGLVCGAGGDALYLPPATWAASPLRDLQTNYPKGCGVKISRATGGVDQPYMTGRPGRYMARRMSYPHSKQLLTYNVLHAAGLAPRLYDLVEVETPDGTLRVCYVVEHVTAAALEENDCTRVVTQLRDLETQGLLKLISAAGWSGVDFQKPDCNGNLIRSVAYQRPLYVDIHNFTLPGHQLYLSETWREAATFAPEPPVLTDDARAFYARLLDNEIARSAEAAAMADASLRLLDEAHVSLADRVAVHWGCVHPLDSAEALRRGARWLHAFRDKAALPSTERLLLALGCTRFSLAPMPAADRDAAVALPPFLSAIGGSDALLHYRSGPDETGWQHEALALPWKYMLFEHPAQTGDFQARLDALAARLPVRLVGSREVLCEASPVGHVALIERTSR